MDLTMFRNVYLRHIVCYSLLVLLFSSQIVPGESYSTASDDSVATTVPPSLITCYECASDGEGNATCSGVEESENNVTRVECPWPNNACMKISTVHFKVGPSGDYEIVTNLTERLCATSKHSGCDRYDGAQSELMECFCKSDLCNSGHVIVTSLTTCLCVVLFGNLFRRLL